VAIPRRLRPRRRGASGQRRRACAGACRRLVDQVRSLALDKAAAPTAARVEVVVGQLDPRLHLAPCERIEPYLPANVRLWGKSRIGLRCTEGRTAWNVYLPIVVKVWGRALVVPAGAAAAASSPRRPRRGRGRPRRGFTAVFFDRKLVVGRTLAQALRPGQAVRQAHIKSRQWFAAGDAVKVVAVGDGFALEGVGQALTNGIEGQPAKVRTEKRPRRHRRSLRRAPPGAGPVSGTPREHGVVAEISKVIAGGADSPSMMKVPAPPAPPGEPHEDRTPR
jgi:flagella basal body P-ring formation protein FlgA